MAEAGSVYEGVSLVKLASDISTQDNAAALIYVPCVCLA